MEVEMVYYSKITIVLITKNVSNRGGVMHGI